MCHSMHHSFSLEFVVSVPGRYCGVVFRLDILTRWHRYRTALSANPPADCPTDLPPAPAACLVGTPAPAPTFSPQPVTPTPTGGGGKMDGGGGGKMDGGMSGGSKEGMSGGSKGGMSGGPKEGMSGGSKDGMSGGSKDGMSGDAKGGTKKSDDAPKAPKTAKTSGRNR
jgi:hypothetical protein